uniref:Uncharacterized protein n=1 Tax=Setaria italica TaxID=4555 RepID=K3ZG71_SETIT
MGSFSRIWIVSSVCCLCFDHVLRHIIRIITTFIQIPCLLDLYFPCRM